MRTWRESLHVLVVHAVHAGERRDAAAEGGVRDVRDALPGEDRVLAVDEES